MRFHKLIGCLVLALGLGLSAQSAIALELPIGGALRPNGLLPNPGAQRLQLSPADAARIAQQRNGGGRVLSVDPGDDGYRVKLLKNGDVRIVYVPGR